MKKRIALVVLSIIVNLAGKHIAHCLSLPLWLDAFGTCLTAYAMGPLWGAAVGAMTNILYSLINPVAMTYSVTSIVIGIAVGLLSRRGWMSTLLKAMSLSVVVTASSVIVSLLLNVYFYGGKTGNFWGDGIIDMLESWGVPFPVRIFVGEFYVDFLDKVITLGLLYAAIRLYRKTRHKLLKSLVWTFALCMVCVIPLSAQEEDFSSYVRTVYNNQGGLPGGEANDIASTQDGILWIGTYGGLYRHNGHEFTLMNEFSSIKNVNTLFVDGEGRLLVGTNDNGLSVVQDGTVLYTVEQADGLPSDSVRCITRASDGTYYVGTASYLALVSLDGGAHIVRTVPQVTYAKNLSADSAGNVAAVTNKGDLFLLSADGAISREERSGRTFTAVLFSQDGALYAATGDNAIITFDVSDGFSATAVTDCPQLSHINSLTQDGQRLFVCADNGAGYLDATHGYHAVPTGDFNNSIERMIFDYQGNIWFSSSRLGLLKMCESAFTEIYQAAGFETAVVNSIAAFNGKLYFGTDTGLSLIDMSTGHAAQDALTRRLESVRIRCLMLDSTDSLWLCTAGAGILRVQADGTVQTFGSSGKKYRSALELSDGTVAVGGDDGILFIKDGAVTGTITQEDGLLNSRVLTMSQRPDGRILCGTDGGGLAMVQDMRLIGIVRKGQGLSSDVILRTVSDTSGAGEFLVTSNGLCYLDAQYNARELTNFPYSNNYDVVQTENGNLFVLGSAGIFVVNKAQLLSGDTVDYELLDLKKGLSGSLTANSWNYRDGQNNLYLSCDVGASMLNLDSYTKGEHSYRIQLKSATVGGVKINASEIVIPSDVETIELEPEVINYSINNSYVSLYLEGVDERPNVMRQSELSSVIYSNLRAGSYTFHLGILDSKGHYLVDEVTYSIIKQAHVYENWWFKVYAVFVMMLAIAWLTWFLTATHENKKREAQEKELQLIKRQVQMGNETIFTIANAVEARDTQTGHHSFRVAEYSALIAKELGFTEPQLENLRKAALLHDIGKIGIPDAILNKPGKLTDEEYSIMKTHVDRGGEILKSFTLIEHVSDGAKYHHERYDGTGYNCGLKGEEIPLNARIIGIADAFDAMTANRVYRKTLDIQDVKAELVRCRGTQFDPALTDIMLRLIEDGTLDVKEVYRRSENAKQQNAD